MVNSEYVEAVLNRYIKYEEDKIKWIKNKEHSEYKLSKTEEKRLIETYEKRIELIKNIKFDLID